MSETMQYRGYYGSVLCDKEDRLLHGKLLGIRDFVMYDGEDEKDIETSFRGAVDEYLRFCREDGKELEVPFSMFPIHFPRELQLKAFLFAEEHDVELDMVIQLALTKYLARAA